MAELSHFLDIYEAVWMPGNRPMVPGTESNSLIIYLNRIVFLIKRLHRNHQKYHQTNI